jgi:sugar phosphate isomerase/epimerase
LLTAARLGVQGVEIDVRNQLPADELSRTGVRQIRKMLDDLNLRVVAASFPTQRGYDVAADLERRIDATKRAMGLAYDLGASVLLNHIGRVPAESQGAEWDTLREALADIGAHGQRVGALLAAETLADGGKDYARLIAALPLGSLGISLNPGQLVQNSHSPAEAVRLLGGHILHVHVTDGARDVSRRRGIETQLGRGAVDWPEVLGLLAEQDYRGWYTLERRDAVEPEQEFEQALRYLEQL